MPAISISRLTCLVPFAAALVGCATTPETKPLAETVVTPRPVEAIAPPPATAGGRFDAKAFASTAYTPRECSDNAKDLFTRSRENGWAGLRGCVERGTFPRGNFTDLRSVLNGPWAEDLPTLQDAPNVVARVIALRGGDVEGDLKTVQTARVPVFSLQAAMAQPDVYKGRHLLVRAEIETARTKAEGSTMRLAEQSLQGSMQEGEVAGDRKGGKRKGAADYQGEVSGDVNLRGSASVRRSSESQDTVVRTTYDNKLTRTGRRPLARLVTPDPFLEPGKSYVFLVRFDGVRKSPGDSDDEGDTIGVVSIVGYFAPSPMLVD